MRLAATPFNLLARNGFDRRSTCTRGVWEVHEYGNK